MLNNYAYTVCSAPVLKSGKLQLEGAEDRGQRSGFRKLHKFRNIRSPSLPALVPTGSYSKALNYTGVHLERTTVVV
uniref:Uncharacterized protein n=1 Tax=Anguilla anguilla TaxID=7936 RepID=A0A0E9X0K1_ANGAN